MDISFDIINSGGDRIRVALSYYDSESIRVFSSDPLTLTLVFYDVTLTRVEGNGYVGYKVLFAVSDTLANFMSENDDAVLCFYCDASTDVRRNHSDMLPQEYRSHLFSRMFEMYTRSHNITGLINHRVEVDDPNNERNRQFAHFICKKDYKEAVERLGQILMNK